VDSGWTAVALASAPQSAAGTSGERELNRTEGSSQLNGIIGSIIGSVVIVSTVRLIFYVNFL